MGALGGLAGCCWIKIDKALIIVSKNVAAERLRQRLMRNATDSHNPIHRILLRTGIGMELIWKIYILIVAVKLSIRLGGSPWITNNVFQLMELLLPGLKLHLRDNVHLDSRLVFFTR
jgi:hypothetical protein